MKRNQTNEKGLIELGYIPLTKVCLICNSRIFLNPHLKKEFCSNSYLHKEVQ